MSQMASTSQVASALLVPPMLATHSAASVERRKNKDVVRENARVHQRVIQLLHQKLVQKAAKGTILRKFLAVQSKSKRQVCFLNELS